MGTMRFAIRMLKADFKKSLFYCGSLVFSTMIVFVFFNMTANPAYGGDVLGRSQSFTTILSLIVIVMSMVMVFFANSFYLVNRAKELAIESLSGGTVLNLAGYLLTQNLLIFLLAIPLGIALGYVCIPLINGILYPYLGVYASLYEVFPVGVVYTVISLLTEIVWLVLVDTGYAYRTEILELMHMEKRMRPTKEGTFKLPGIIFVVIFLFPLLLILISEPDPLYYLAVSCLSLFGISGILKRVLPKLIAALMNRYFLSHKYFIVSFNNLLVSLKKSTTLIQMVIISSTFLVCFMCAYQNDLKQLVIVVMSYVVLTVMMAVSILYQVILSAMDRKKSFHHLKMIGYLQRDLRKMIAQEVVGFYGLVILFPLIYLLAIFFQFIQTGIISFGFGVGIILFDMIVFSLAGILSYVLYCRSILEGGKRS